jgi:hypothetical protein
MELIMTIHALSNADLARTSRSPRVARQLLERALAGELEAIKEFHDRVEGKAHVGKRVDQPTKVIIEWVDSHLARKK